MRSQQTLSQICEFVGKGVHSGIQTRVLCQPAPTNHGITFKQIMPEAHVSRDSGERRTFVMTGEGRVDTVEHFLAACWACGISNMTVEVNGPELPILDGSSAAYVQGFVNGGLSDQGAPRPVFEPKEPLFVSKKKGAILMLPDEKFRITYTLDYDQSLLKAQTLSQEITPESLKDEFCNARTFCTEDEAETLLKMGYGKGATTENTLVMTAQGPKKNTLRYPDECLRHKVLDLVGDLALTGFDFKAHIIAIRSGHNLNRLLKEKIQEGDF